jgi:hypothetical protein
LTDRRLHPQAAELVAHAIASISVAFLTQEGWSINCKSNGSGQIQDLGHYQETTASTNGLDFQLKEGDGGISSLVASLKGRQG